MVAQQQAEKAKSEQRMGITVAGVVGVMLLVGLTKWAMDWREISNNSQRHASRDDDWTYHGPDES